MGRTENRELITSPTEISRTEGILQPRDKEHSGSWSKTTRYSTFLEHCSIPRYRVRPWWGQSMVMIRKNMIIILCNSLPGFWFGIVQFLADFFFQHFFSKFPSFILLFWILRLFNNLVRRRWNTICGDSNFVFECFDNLLVVIEEEEEEVA